jgi:hypothetical protein
MTDTTYMDFVKTRPVWTGGVALLCFTIMLVCALPKVRRKHFELFQRKLEI